MLSHDVRTTQSLIASRREGSPRRSLSDIATLTTRNLRLDLRNPGVTIGNTLFPISLLLIFTASFAKVVDPNGTYADYAQFLVPLNVLQGLLFGSVNVGTAFYEDLEGGMDARLRTLPIARSAALVARIIASAGRFFIQVVLITLVGMLLGFRLAGGPLFALAFLLVPVMFVSAFACIAVFLALRVSAPESINVAMTPWLLPLTFLSVGYVPLEGFPAWLQPVVAVNPVSTASQTMRGLATGTLDVGNLGLMLGWLGAIALIFGTLATHAYARRSA